MTRQKFVFPKSGPSGTEISNLIGEAVPHAAPAKQAASESRPATPTAAPPTQLATPVTMAPRKESRVGRKPINTIDGAKVQMVIDPYLLKSLRVKAVEMETTISRIVEGLVREFLKT